MLRSLVGSEMCIRDSFCLVQQDACKNLILVQCGSCSLTPAQQRYATIELELMAIQWATVKCDYYLRGLPTFQVWTDHRPLLGIFKQCLTQIDNPRLLRMWEKLMPYCFTTKWVPGKDHKIADALSRFPVFSPDASIDVPVAEVMQCQRTYNAAGHFNYISTSTYIYQCFTVLIFLLRLFHLGYMTTIYF